MSLSTVSYGGGLDNLSVKQLSGMGKLLTEFPDLQYRVNNSMGRLKYISNGAEYLSPKSTDDPEVISSKFTESILSILDIDSEDLVVDSSYTNSNTGNSVVHYIQTYKDIPVYHGILQYSIDRQGRVYSVSNDTIPSISTLVKKTIPSVSEKVAVNKSYKDSGIPRDGSTEKIKLELYSLDRTNVRLVWNVTILNPNTLQSYEYLIDATTKDILSKTNMVSAAPQIKAYDLPVGSPLYSDPAYTSDGRTTIVYTPGTTASPNGWHRDGLNLYTNMRGNNVYVFPWEYNTSSPMIPEPDCGYDLDCVFSLDLTSSSYVSSNLPAYTANLFYLANRVHDIMYLYGFDEDAGNHQAYNFGRGGKENDPIYTFIGYGPDVEYGAIATSIGTTDGTVGYVQMGGNFDCASCPYDPIRHSALSAYVYLHELYHQYNGRMVGGPNVVCDGSGPNGDLSEHVDFPALLLLSLSTDTASTKKPTGNWVFDQSASGNGNWTRCNFNADLSDIPPNGCGDGSGGPAWTFATIEDPPSPWNGVYDTSHILAMNLWMVYWKLRTEHGFGDVGDHDGGKGNQRMMLYYHEGLMNTACNPGFLDYRDAIIGAATNNYSGEDVCLVWEGFAVMGMGYSAVGTPGSVANGFDVPPACE